MKRLGLVCTKTPDVGLDTTPWTASSSMLNSGRHRQANRVIVAEATPHPDTAGRLADTADEWETDIDAALERLLQAARIFLIMGGADARRKLACEHTIICSDGIARGRHPPPHVWGTFPGVPGHYVADVFDLDGDQAHSGRKHADVVVFDAAPLAERGRRKPATEAVTPWWGWQPTSPVGRVS